MNINFFSELALTDRVRYFQAAGSILAASSSENNHRIISALLPSRSEGDASAKARRAELESLLQETDPAMLAEALLNMAGREENAGTGARASEIYAALLALPCPQPYLKRAQDRLNVLRGSGAFGAQIEMLGRQFAQQASSPAMLGAMAIGSFVFQAARYATLSRLLSSPTSSLWTRGLGARGLSWATGFALEVPSFTLGGRALQELSGSPLDWSLQTVSRDTLSSGITLFFLKGLNAAATPISRNLLAGESATSAWSRFSATALPQLATFTGILSAHTLEARLGLRPNLEAGHAVVESLATLLQFHVAGNLMRGPLRGFEDRSESLHRILREPRLPPPSQEQALEFGEALRPAFASVRHFPFRDSILMMSSEGPQPKAPPISDFAPSSAAPAPEHIPIRVAPEFFQSLRSQFSRLESELNYAYNEQSGDGMWTQQSHRVTLELIEQLRLLDLYLPNPQDRPQLHEVRGELRGVMRMLDDLRKSEDLPHSSSEIVRNFIGALYRVPNKAVNYINSGHPRDLFGTLQNARDARLWLHRDIFRLHQVNADAEEYHANTAEVFPRRSNIDPENPAVLLHTPHYEYRDEFESPFLEIPGKGRSVVLVGDIPYERLELADQHSLELLASDSAHYSRLAGEAANRGYIQKVSVVWQQWRPRRGDAEYLEAYDVASFREIAGNDGETLVQERVLNRLRPGGIALIISRDPRALERMVQISTQKQWADVVLGSFNGHLPVEVSRPDQESGHFVFLRKLPEN